MAKVRPIPKGYHSVTPGLSVQGADAFIKFCKKAFGAKEVMRMAGPGGSVMHAELVIGDSHIMCGEEMPSIGNKSAKTLGGTPVQLYIFVPNCDAVFKKAIAAGAAVRMPMANMFWGDRLGSVIDPFGNTWGIATRIENLTPREMKKRGDAWMKQQAASTQTTGVPS
jgi:PhnB protein